MADTAIADMVNATSPLTAAGIDPDQALLDRVGTMQRLFAPDAWQERIRAQVDGHSPGQAQGTGSAATVPGSVTPAGDATAGQPEDLQQKNVANLTQGMASLDQGDKVLQSMQAQPDLDRQTAGIQAQLDKDNVAIDPNAVDPTTGKAKYKPSFGQRLLRGVEGAARGGFITPAAMLGVIDPAALGGTAYGAPNKQYGTDVQAQQGRVAADRQQLQQATDNYKARSERAATMAQLLRDQAQARQALAIELIGQQRVPIAQEQAQTRAEQAYNSSPAGKAETVSALNAVTPQGGTRPGYAQRGNRQRSSQGRGQAANPGAGAVTPPSRNPVADRVGNRGRDPVGSIVADATGRKQAFADSYERQADGRYRAKDGTNILSPQEFDQKLDGYRLQANQRLANKGYEIDTRGQIVPIAANKTSSIARPAGQVPAGAPQQPGEVAVIHPDGTPGYIPAESLQRALQRGYTQAAAASPQEER